MTGDEVLKIADLLDSLLRPEYVFKMAHARLRSIPMHDKVNQKAYVKSAYAQRYNAAIEIDRIVREYVRENPDGH